VVKPRHKRTKRGTVTEKLGLKKSGTKVSVSDVSAAQVTPVVRKIIKKTAGEGSRTPDLDKHGYRIPVEAGVELFDDKMPARLSFGYGEYDYSNQEQ